MSKTALNSKAPKGGSKKAFSESKGTKYDGRRRIGLLAGNDISALILLNTVIPQLVASNFKPVIYMAEHQSSIKPDAKQLELQEFSFYERYLSNNVLLPVLDEMEPQVDEYDKPIKGLLYSPQHLAELYDLDIETVEDINSSEFVEKIANEDNMPILVSIRCYQIAHTPLIKAQTKKKFELDNGEKTKGAIWNMHPGKLPGYQGIFTPLYAINDNQRTFAWSLHELIYDLKDPHKGIDKGDLITKHPSPIDYSAPVIELYTRFARPAGEMLYGRVEDYFTSGVPKTPQPKQEGEYYTHPTPDFFRLKKNWPTALARLVKLGKSTGFAVDEEVKEMVKEGMTEPQLVDPDAMLTMLMSGFFENSKAPGYARARNALKKDIETWEDNKIAFHKNHEQAHPESPYGVVDHYIMSEGRRLPNGLEKFMTDEPTVVELTDVPANDGVK